MSAARRCSASPPKANSSPWRRPARSGSSPDARGRDVLGRGVLRPRQGAADARGAGRLDRRRHHAQVRPIRPAAVLVPIVDHPEPTVLLTQRAQHLPDHPGQVSFPGGKIDKTDRDPMHSALREAHEEIGLAEAHVEPLGYLDVYMTTLGYRIVPVIARVKPGFKLTLNKAEVDSTFEVPLAYVMDLANMQRHSRDWNGMTRHYYAITFGERYIWGVTAGILRNLYDRIYRE